MSFLHKLREFPSKLHISTRCMLIIVALMIVLNVVAWCSTTFSDWYAETVFPAISRVFSQIWGHLSFSVGEIMIAIAILLVIGGLITWIILMIFKKGKRWKISCIFGRIAGWILTFVFVTETCNCFVLYHATSFGEKYFTVQTYTNEELLTLYTDLVDIANDLSTQVERDEDGNFILQDDLYTTASKAMQNLGQTYTFLQGEYPLPKPIAASYLMSQMRLTGIYFPFSLEANYNADMMDINLPDTICHEFSHLRGVMQEDEAGFISFLACIQSESIDFQYSGVISALEYVQNALISGNVADIDDALNARADGVQQDMFSFVPEDYWEEKQETVPVLIATETVQTMSDTAMDTSLKLNGVEDGKQSYSRIVNLLLAYWDSLGYFNT